MIRGEVPEKARQAYGMGCGGVDTIPTQRRGSSAWARMVLGGRPRRWATSATERQWTVTSGGGGRDGPSHGADQRVDPAGPGDYGEPEVDPGRGPGHGDRQGAALTFTPADGVDDDELVDRLVDYHPAVGPSDLVSGAREAVITLPAASLSQAITTVRAVAAPLGVLHGLEIVPTAAWDHRLGRTTNEDDLIGVTEAAGALGVTPQAVRERLAAGTLPGRKIGRNWALPASALHR